MPVLSISHCFLGARLTETAGLLTYSIQCSATVQSESEASPLLPLPFPPLILELGRGAIRQL